MLPNYLLQKTIDFERNKSKQVCPSSKISAHHCEKLAAIPKLYSLIAELVNFGPIV